MAHVRMQHNQAFTLQLTNIAQQHAKWRPFRCPLPERAAPGSPGSPMCTFKSMLTRQLTRCGLTSTTDASVHDFAAMGLSPCPAVTPLALGICAIPSPPSPTPTHIPPQASPSPLSPPPAPASPLLRLDRWQMAQGACPRRCPPAPPPPPLPAPPPPPRVQPHGLAPPRPRCRPRGHQLAAAAAAPAAAAALRRAATWTQAPWCLAWPTG